MIDRGDSRLIGSIERNAEANEFVIRADKFENDIYFELQLFSLSPILCVATENTCVKYSRFIFCFTNPLFRKLFNSYINVFSKKFLIILCTNLFIDLSIITEIEMETYEIENTK